MRLFRSLPSSDFSPLPSSLHSISCSLFCPSIYASVFHPRRRSTPFHSSDPLLPCLFPSLPSFFLFPSFITLVCAVARSRDRSLTNPRPVGFSEKGSTPHFFSGSRRSRNCSMFRHPITGWNLLMSGVDLLDGDTGTPTVSQQSESGQGLLCVKEGHKTANWLGCGGRRSDHCWRCGEGIVESLPPTVIVERQ